MPSDRLASLANGQTLPDRAHGAALFANISGFTRLTEQLTQSLGARRGIEEVTLRINKVLQNIGRYEIRREPTGGGMADAY